MSSSGACTPLSLLHPTHLQTAACQDAKAQLQQQRHSLHGKFHHGHLAAGGVQAARHRPQQLSRASRVAIIHMGSSMVQCAQGNSTAPQSRHSPAIWQGQCAMGSRQSDKKARQELACTRKLTEERTQRTRDHTDSRTRQSMRCIHLDCTALSLLERVHTSHTVSDVTQRVREDREPAVGVMMSQNVERNEA